MNNSEQIIKDTTQLLSDMLSSESLDDKDFRARMFRLYQYIQQETNIKLLDNFQVLAHANGYFLDSATSKQIMQFAHNNQKINAIKTLREATGLGLKPAKDLVDLYCEKFVKE